MNESEMNRLWQHRTNAESNFNNRLNFFLVFESLLLAAVAQLIQSNKIRNGYLITIIIFGIAVTVIWLLIQEKERRILDVLKCESRKNIPDYHKMTIHIDKGSKWLECFKINLVLTWIVPVLVVLIWGVMLLAVINSKEGSGVP